MIGNLANWILFHHFHFSDKKFELKNPLVNMFHSVPSLEHLAKKNFSADFRHKIAYFGRHSSTNCHFIDILSKNRF